MNLILDAVSVNGRNRGRFCYGISWTTSPKERCFASSLRSTKGWIEIDSGCWTVTRRQVITDNYDWLSVVYNHRSCFNFLIQPSQGRHGCVGRSARSFENVWPGTGILLLQVRARYYPLPTLIIGSTRRLIQYWCFRSFHDIDNNTKLDGLEILHAILHTLHQHEGDDKIEGTGQGDIEDELPRIIGRLIALLLIFYLEIKLGVWFRRFDRQRAWRRRSGQRRIPRLHRVRTRTTKGRERTSEKW